MRYRTPGGIIYRLFADMANQPHLLIAGATGSGKSVAENGIIATLLQHSPARVQLILIDPKRVELAAYRKLPHVIKYASEPDTMPDALQKALDIIEDRYRIMQRADALQYDGPDVYVIIDELADLMTTAPKVYRPLLQRIAQIGRAARVHCIACTQCPLSCVIPTPIKVNFDARLALRTACAQDSRNIIGAAGCELLPQYGTGIYRTARGLERVSIPYVTRDDIRALVDYWTSSACIA